MLSTVPWLLHIPSILDGSVFTLMQIQANRRVIFSSITNELLGSLLGECGYDADENPDENGHFF